MSALGQLKTSYLLIFTKLNKLFFTALLLETLVFRLLCQELKELNKQRYTWGEVTSHMCARNAITIL